MDALQICVGPESLEETRVVLEAALECVVVANGEYYRRYPNGPCCPKCAGVRYQEPVGSIVSFSSIEPMFVAGYGSCGDIAAMVAAKHRFDGDSAARVVLEMTDPRERAFHAVVELGDGRRLDPTADLIAATEDCGCPVES